MCLEGRLGSGTGQGQQYFLQPDSRMTPNVWDIRPPLGHLVTLWAISNVSKTGHEIFWKTNCSFRYNKCSLGENALVKMNLGIPV